MKVCKESGGTAYVVKDFRHAVTVCTSLAQKILNNHPSVTVGINVTQDGISASKKASCQSSLSSSSSSSNLSAQQSLLTQVFISKYAPYEWQIPENYWMNAGSNFELVPRPSYPSLLLTYRTYSVLSTHTFHPIPSYPIHLIH